MKSPAHRSAPRGSAFAPSADPFAVCGVPRPASAPSKVDFEELRTLAETQRSFRPQMILVAQESTLVGITRVTLMTKVKSPMRRV
jgi:hypothetical protein